jgi:pimeloyl-ACP methyl ester carboxylesterase
MRAMRSTHPARFAARSAAMITLFCAIGCVTPVAAAPAASAASPAASAVAPCANFFGQRCRIALATGVHMSYFELGSAAGETLILLHTDTTSALEWAWTVTALLALDPSLQVFALDQRGAGDSALPDTPLCWSTPNRCITRADLAADVLAFMDAKHIARATLVGHAMGAGAARSVALQFPARVVRLILSGTGPAAPAQPPASAAPSATPPARRSDGMEALGWQAMAEAQGVKWPEGALHMRPLDIDPDAVQHITENWDISAIAAPAVVRAIAAQTAAESFASWGRLDHTPPPAAPAEALEQLAVPTLVLWGSEDSGLDRASQDRLMASLTLASRRTPGMYFYWKQYGVGHPPASGNKHDADDIGHNLSWEAPRQLAADIDSFIRTGVPTSDRYRTDAPTHIRTILVEPGKATIVSSKSAPTAN